MSDRLKRVPVPEHLETRFVPIVVKVPADIFYVIDPKEDISDLMEAADNLPLAADFPRASFQRMKWLDETILDIFNVG